MARLQQLGLAGDRDFPNSSAAPSQELSGVFRLCSSGQGANGRIAWTQRAKWRSQVLLMRNMYPIYI